MLVLVWMVFYVDFILVETVIFFIFFKLYNCIYGQLCGNVVNMYVQMLYQIQMQWEQESKSNYICIYLCNFEQWPDFGCEGIKVQRAHQPTSQCQGKKKDRKSTRLNSSHITRSRMPSSA
eukprot:TRINITY_DN9243_c0_g1_i14.p2 TRINITY_DN9243_c0_g1~~TRINITY_DN9243_c0_g1_i14.p2  ORF type:complete len:134 (+),score=3.43 TRINITY_DN9243_c0_g1_i14:43-402(+)